MIAAHSQGEPFVRAGDSFPWDRSICLAALTTGKWETSDAAADFPATVGTEAGVRSYCGVPVFAPDGEIIATLCAVDSAGAQPTTAAASSSRSSAGS